MKHVGTKLEQSERRVCRVLAQPRSTQRYKPVARDEERPLLKRISELVRKHTRRGYPPIDPQFGFGVPGGWGTLGCGIVASASR